MTSGPTPTPIPKNEAEYARKLALAILSTLESKGFLTRLDVDTILQVAHRTAMSAQAEGEPNAVGMASGAADPEAPASAPASLPPAQAAPSVLTAPIEVKRPIGPAVLGTRWVKPEGQRTDSLPEISGLENESGMRVVGKSAAQDRPLAPPILTDRQKGRTEPGETEPSPPEQAAKTELKLEELEARVAENHKQTTPVPEHGDSALVIDLNLD